MVLVKERKCGGSSGVREGFAKEVTLEPGLEGMEFITQKGFPRKRNCEERWKGTDLWGGMNSEVSSGRPEGRWAWRGRAETEAAARPHRSGPALPSRQPGLRMGRLMPFWSFPHPGPHPGPHSGAPLTWNMPFPQIFLSSKTQLLCHLF